MQSISRLLRLWGSLLYKNKWKGTRMPYAFYIRVLACPSGKRDPRSQLRKNKREEEGVTLDFGRFHIICAYDFGCDLYHWMHCLVIFFAKEFPDIGQYLSLKVYSNCCCPQCLFLKCSQTVISYVSLWVTGNMIWCFGQNWYQRSLIHLLLGEYLHHQVLVLSIVILKNIFCEVVFDILRKWLLLG